MSGFEAAHADYIRYHLKMRSGERRGRLLDWRGIPYFADYMYAPYLWRIVIEIKGFGPHVRNMDRQKYCNELNRETFLHGMGYNVISFAYDDVANRPDQCIYLLRSVLSRYEPSNTKRERVFFADLEILRYAVFLARAIRPIDIAKHFSMDHRTAVSHLKRLSQKGWLKPLLRGKGKRILYYEVTMQGLRQGL